MNQLRCRHLLLLGIMIAAGSCSPTQTLGSRYVKSETVSAEQGLTISVTDKQCPELAGTRLVIPPGALPTTTEINLELGSTALIDGTAKPAGAVAIWGPAGTRFSMPVELTLPYALAEGEDLENLFVQVNEDDGSRFVIEHTLLSIDTEAKLVRFSINGFTGFQPGTRPPAPCGQGPACSTEQTCVNDRCQQTTGCGQGPACSTGMTCLNGTCQQTTTRCGQGPACSTGLTCVNGACQQTTTGCGQGPACSTGETCINGTCQRRLVCRSTGDCAQGQSCVNGACQQTLSCTTTADCPQGDSCLNGTCQTTISGCSSVTGQGCTGTDVCVNGACQPASSICSAQAPCPQGQSCVNGACQHTCVPTTCVNSNATCGVLQDGCGGSLNCGVCASPLSCQRNTCR